jgi:hypothetical protein
MTRLAYAAPQNHSTPRSPIKGRAMNAPASPTAPSAPVQLPRKLVSLLRLWKCTPAVKNHHADGPTTPLPPRPTRRGVEWPADLLGNGRCQGPSSTVGVTLETMRHHTECNRGLRRAQWPGSSVRFAVRVVPRVVAEQHCAALSP